VRNNMSFVTLLIGVMIFGLTTRASATTDRYTLPFQGLLTDASDVALTNTSVPVIFEITADVAGTCVIYRENQTLTTDAKGMGSALIGQGTTPTMSTSITSFQQAFTVKGTLNCLPPGTTATVDGTSARYLRLTVNSVVATSTIALASVPFADEALNTQAIDNTTVNLSAGALNGQYLMYNGSYWSAQYLPTSVSSVTAGGGLSNSGTAMAPILNVTYGTAASTALQGNQPFSGDVSGTVGAISVDKIKGFPLNITSPATNQVLTYNGTTWVNAAPPASGTVTSVSTTAPLSVTTPTTTPAISITQATTSTSGYLSSTDWNTFSNKVGGSGTAGKLPKWSASSALADSLVSDNGTTVSVGGTLDMTTNKIINLATPTVSTDAVTMGYAATTYAPLANNYIKGDGTTALTNNWNTGGSFSIINLKGMNIGSNAAPVSSLDVNFTNSAASGTAIGMQILPTYTQTATAGATDLLINRTQTSLGSGQQNLIDAQVGGVSKFRVDNIGKIYGDGSNITNIPGIISGLTNGRVVLSNTSNSIMDSATLTFNTGTNTLNLGGSFPVLSFSGTQAGSKVWSLNGNSGGGTGTGTVTDENAYLRIVPGGSTTFTIIGPDGRMELGYPGNQLYLPQSMLDVNGGVAVGSYAGHNPAPTNGLIVSGNVGIGTLVPATALDINGAQTVREIAAASAPAAVAGKDFLYADNVSHTLKLSQNGGAYADILTTGSTSGPFVLKSGDAMTGTLTLPSNGLMVGGNQLVVSGGNVGIGSAAPGNRLDIAGAGGQWVTLYSNTGSGNAGLKIFYGAGNFPSTPSASIFASSNDSYLDAGNNNKLHLRVQNGGTDALVIDTIGNIGIGTTSPADPLTVRVAANENFTVSALGAAGFTTIGAGNDTNTLLEPLEITGSTIYLTGGNVGIGTSAPGAMLDVNGSANINGMATLNGGIKVGPPAATFINGYFKLLNQVWSGSGTITGGSNGLATYSGIGQASVGDTVICNPRSTLPAYSSYYCYVSAVGVVTITINNNGASTMSGLTATSWDITVIH